MDSNVRPATSDGENVSPTNNNYENMNMSENNSQENTTLTDRNINNNLKLNQDGERTMPPVADDKPPSSLYFASSPTSSTPSPTSSTLPPPSYYSPPTTPGFASPVFPSSVLVDEDSTSENHGTSTEMKQTSKEERNIYFKEAMSINLSKMYCIAVFMAAILIYVGDSLSKSGFVLAEYFNIYLMVVHIIWLAFVHHDIRKYLQFVSETVSQAQGTQPDSSSGSETCKPLKTITAADRYYGFASGRHSAGGSIYLKAGATVFFFGYIIWLGLTLGTSIQHLQDDTCYNLSHIIMTSVEIIHVAYQLFFVFKYSNLIINRWINFSRFGVMHSIATSACLWFYFLYHEILLAIDAQNSFVYTDTIDPIPPVILPEPVNPILNTTTTTVPPEEKWNIYYGCRNSSDIDEVMTGSGPYLFPFAIEFNLVVIGLWIAVWQNLGKMGNHTHYPSVLIKTGEDQSKSFYSNLHIHVDCHSSNRGLFAGMLTMILTVISVVFFFVIDQAVPTTRSIRAATNFHYDFPLVQIIRGITEGVLLLLLLTSTLVAYSSIRTLDIVKGGFRSVDNILLFITLPFIFFFALCTMIPYFSITEGVHIPPEEIIFVIVMILYAIQPVVQTAFICDGLHRCSNSSELQTRKPGREAITYLIVTNVTMWLFETLQINTYGANKEGFDFYEPVMWSVISHLGMPFAVFFRFHSSACMADIWSYAYEADT
ncbi:unnamed protein product, partial [Meganyctiphanes norvegica]